MQVGFTSRGTVPSHRVGRTIVTANERSVEKKGDIMMAMLSSTSRALLRAGAGGFALAVALAATPTLAQTAPAQGQATAAQGADADQGSSADEVVVTGTLFKGNKTISPVTTLTTDELDSRAINTVQDAL